MTFRRSSGSDASVATLFVIAAILAVGPSTATSRAVNISSTWFLPQEGFPVFYRYFRDRITWFEADAVCQFHHANLVTVDTSVQYDATRAYLKELDIVNNVWIGLKKVGPADEFAWTDSKNLSPNGGYWQEQIPKSSSPLCAAVDPAADFRWHSLNCGGPEVASFICEMPVPPWAQQDGGCMLTSLPSLTVIFLPEQSAIELTSDCGLDGTRRIACKGEADREEMMRELSCTHGGVTQEDDVGSVSPDVTSSSSATSFSSSMSVSSSSYPSSSSGTTGFAGTRSWTGHHQTPTRHRRDADVDHSASSQMISLIKSTTAVTAETTVSVTTVGTVIALKKGTEAMTSSDATTSTTDEDFSTEATTNIPLDFTESSVTGSNAVTNQDSQLSTMGEKTEQATAGLLVSTVTPEDDPLDGGVFSQFKELRVIPGNSSPKDVKETSTEQITTINVLSPSSQAVNTYQMEATATQMPTASVVLATDSTATDAIESESVVVQNTTEPEAKNSTEGTTLPSTVRATVVMATTSQPKTGLVETTAETTASVPDNNDDVAYLIMQERNQKTSDEINSREEDEEERLKEEERKEKEKRFKEEEENRRQLFMPTPLRNAPETENESSSKVPAPLVMEDPYEEPGEMIEPEPEVPSRPNRGRRLTRPQTHSFYPYFLNRVLG